MSEQTFTRKTFTRKSFQEWLDQSKLMASRCASCGAVYLPPRPLCPACYGDQMAWVELSGRARLQAYTVIHVAPTAMIEAGYGREKPYCTGVVQLDEGPSFSAQVLGLDVTRPESVVIGAPLQAAFVERGSEEDRHMHLAFVLSE